MREELLEGAELPATEALVSVECAEGGAGVPVVGHVAAQVSPAIVSDGPERSCGQVR